MSTRHFQWRGNWGITFILIISTIIGISNNQWLTVWLFIEVNSLAIGFLISNSLNSSSKNEESTLIYLVSQILGSIVLLLSSLQENSTKWEIIIISSLIINIAGWPIHIWFINILSLISLKNNSLFIIITWQNILPIVIISTLNLSNNSCNILTIICLIIVMIPLQNLNSTTSVNGILGLSSLTNNGWFFISIIASANLTLTIVSLYSSALISILIIVNSHNNKNSNLLNSMVYVAVNTANISGVPPLTIFWANIAILNEITNLEFPTEVMIILIISSSYLIYHYFFTIHVEILQGPPNNQYKNNNNSLHNSIFLITFSSIAALIWLIL